MAGRLADFLESAGRAGFEWGQRDCLLFAADWCVESGRTDPASRYRGRYRTERAAARLLRAAGGVERLAEAEMARAGFEPCTVPKSGDVGLVVMKTPAGDLAMGAVFTGSMWAMVTKGGLFFADVPAARIWSV